MEDTEIIVVDDGSTIDYGMPQVDDKLRWVKMEPYEASRIDGGYNNPAKAFNRGVQEARGENVAIMSSDVIVPPFVLDAPRKIIATGGGVYSMDWPAPTC